MIFSLKYFNANLMNTWFIKEQTLPFSTNLNQLENSLTSKIEPISKLGLMLET